MFPKYPQDIVIPPSETSMLLFKFEKTIECGPGMWEKNLFGLFSVDHYILGIELRLSDLSFHTELREKIWDSNEEILVSCRFVHFSEHFTLLHFYDYYSVDKN